MTIDEDEVYEVLLLSSRLSAMLGLHTENKILRRSLASSALSRATVETWSDVSDVPDREKQVKALYAEIQMHQRIIDAVPDLFKGGYVGSVFQRIMNAAKPWTIAHQPTTNRVYLLNAAKRSSN